MAPFKVEADIAVPNLRIVVSLRLKAFQYEIFEDDPFYATQGVNKHREITVMVKYLIT